MPRSKRSRKDFPNHLKDGSPCILWRCYENGIEPRVAVSRHSVSFSRFNEYVTPSGNFFRRSVNCAPVIWDTLMLTLVTFVAALIPHFSTSPNRFMGVLGGAPNGFRIGAGGGTGVLPVPP